MLHLYTVCISARVVFLALDGVVLTCKTDNAGELEEIPVASVVGIDRYLIAAHCKILDAVFGKSVAGGGICRLGIPVRIHGAGLVSCIKIVCI